MQKVEAFKTGSSALSLQRRFVYGPGLDEPLAAVDASNAHTYQFTDGLGSVIGLANASGQLTERYAYTAFGMGVVAGPGTAAYRYAGRRFDGETGLYHNRARAYSPMLGRFLQADPIGTQRGINVYVYAWNDPLNGTDPMGFFTWQQGAQVAGGAFETLTGIGMAFVTSETGVGIFAGGAMAIHGIDQIQAGIRGADTFTSQGIQSVGVSQNVANAIDTGMSGLSGVTAAGPFVSYARFGVALPGGNGTSLISATARGFVVPGLEISGRVTQDSSPMMQAASRLYGTASVGGIVGRSTSDVAVGTSAGVEAYSVYSSFGSSNSKPASKK